MFIEDCPRLSRKTLAMAGGLNPGAVTHWTWDTANLSVSVIAGPDGFTIADGASEVSVGDPRQRGALICGRCGKKVRYVLWHSGAWGCRHCRHVHYRSDHPEAFKRLTQRILDEYRAYSRQRRRGGSTNC